MNSFAKTAAAPSADDLPVLLRSLLRAEAYPHTTGNIRLIQTHISWVLLTGSYAYKIKKPVHYPFVDFSTLERRHAACRDELWLNRRYASELYLDVVPITGTAQEPHIGGSGLAFEYAVRMHQFPQHCQLDRLLQAGRLRVDDIEQLGRRIAQFHMAAPRADKGAPHGRPEQVQQPVRDNLRDLLKGAATPQQRAQLETLLQWSEARYEQLHTTITARRREGYVREVHGDLHLSNLVRLGDTFTPFDCIEFDENLRWIDVVNDAAFLMMDLAFHRRRDLAYHFINAYLQASGDYAGVRLLNYYRVYRALVRAKIAMIDAENAEPAEQERCRAAVQAHIDLAQRWSAPHRPRLLLMHGLSGSGKTWVSNIACAYVPAVRVRSDAERKRLHGLSAFDTSCSSLCGGLYSPDSDERTYEHLAQAAVAILEGGENAIVDAAFLKRSQRERFRNLAEEAGAECLVLSCTAPGAELRRRVAERMTTHADASEANLAVLDHQFATAEPLSLDEQATALEFDTSLLRDKSDVIAALERPSFPCC